MTNTRLWNAWFTRILSMAFLDHPQQRIWQGSSSCVQKFEKNWGECRKWYWFGWTQQRNDSSYMSQPNGGALLSIRGIGLAIKCMINKPTINGLFTQKAKDMWQKKHILCMHVGCYAHQHHNCQNLAAGDYKFLQLQGSTTLGKVH